MKMKEKRGINVGPGLGHLTYPFWIIRFIGLALIIGKITGEKLI